MSKDLRTVILLVLVAVASTQALVPQTSAADPVQVLVLGTYHFANPGLDVVKMEVADVLSETKQAEIRAVVEALARFRPTKIAVEDMPDSAEELDQLYEAYRSGEYELSRNETQQLGFRLASMLDHPRLHPIDHQGEFPFQAVMQYAQDHDPEFVDFLQKERARMTSEANRRQKENTIGEILRLSNDRQELAWEHGVYMRFAAVAAGDTYVGAELLTKWYERNIHIFSNLQNIAEPGDRILLIMGSGHAPILRELITSHPEMRLVDTLDYLPRD
ncbi:MAG TPA: DUF5694 domain-containing protein [Acidobacteriota bacterium]|nr:DUF5694 domain-containing protein [Acidobacteriota bacterium]